MGDAPLPVNAGCWLLEGQRLARRDSVRVTAAFSRLLRLPEVWVRKVRFEPGRVVVEVALKRRLLRCPLCSYSTRARKDKRPVDSVWRHLDLGVWRLEICCRRRRLWCPEHGVRTEGVPFARHGSEFTRDFECLVAWLATKVDKTTIKRMLRIDWDTVGRIVARVCADELDPGRLDDLYEIGVDEVSWKRQHQYLTLVVDHQRRQVVWGCEGSGAAAADEFFAELDPPPTDPAPEHAKQPRTAVEPAIMVPFGPCPTVPAFRARGSSPTWRSSPRSSRAPGCCARSRWTWVPATRSRCASTPRRRSSASTPITWCSSPTRRWTRSAARTGTSSGASA